MSSLVKLSIQGIRSFGPDDQDRQILKFYSPLTLIQGQNGTGKTTIIECLKYITTGGMPAGGKLQATFIHDPKIAHETTVKAQVRLQFNDITTSRCTTHRTIQATQMAKTIKTSSIDGMISKQGPDGTRNDITNRCADLDREMVALLGVGKPVLESVIFCHQEDSCWPLSEGKALKAKFDDIFASTRYVKALEQLLKERKEKQAEIKNYQGELKYLKQNKDKAAEVEADLTQVKTRYAASREAAEEVKEKLAPIEEKLIKLESKTMDIGKLITEVEKLKAERDQMKRGVQELKDNIEHEFTGSTEDLEDRLSDFEGKVRECEDKLRQYETENQRLETEMNKISDMKSNLLLEMGKLEQEAKAHEENLDKRERKIKQVAEQYGVSGFSGRVNDAKVDEFQQKMEDKRKSLQQKGRDQRAELEEKENKVQANIDQIRQKIASLETEVKLKEEAMAKNKNEVRLINQKLSRVEGSSGRLAELKRELAQTKQDRDELDQSTNVDDLKKEIDNLSSQKNSLEATFKKLDVELTKMHQESTARTQLDMLRKEKTSKDDKIRKLLSKNEDSLIELLGEVPQDRACRQLEDYVSKLDQEIGKDTKTLDALRMQQAGKKQEHTSLTEQLANKKRELRDSEERISAECDAQDFDEARDKLEQSLRDKNDDKGVLEGTSAMFNKFKSKLQKKNPPCPLCHRDFEEDAEVAELVDELEAKLRTVPTRLEQVNEEIADLEKTFHRVLQLEPVTKSVIQIRDTDIPKLEGRIQSVNENIETLTSKIATKENELKAKQAKSSTGHSMVPDLSHIERYQMELRDLNKKIATQSAKVSGGDDGRTLQQVQRERNDAQESLDNTRSSYERKQKKLMDHSRQLSNLDTTLNEMTAERLAIERDLQEQKENEDRREELLACNDMLAVEILECQEQVQPLQTELKQNNRERQEISNDRDSAMVKNKDELSKLQERTRDVRTIQDSIERYLKAGRDTALDDCREKQTSMETKAAALDAKRSTVLEKIEKRREDLQTQKLQERNLHDNLALRRKQKEVEEKAELITEKQEKLGDLDTRNLEREKQKLRQQQADLIKQQHQTDGRQQGFLDQIRGFKKDLEGEQYKDAEGKFRIMSHTLRTTEHVCSDLEKYYKAMDKAIMTFHKTKIDEINKIIRELWRNTYKGHDIETIEIRSDDESEPASLGKRRTFNYRVVMVKGEVAIDMRGRCSAGQKVLSSLIIRLALAETFCLNCGVLALDEPTTNLDRENIESLAYALVEIIKTRSKQKNFQLVIITHDEDFVELLGRSNFVEKFVKVRKNEFGCSRLVEADVSELGTR